MIANFENVVKRALDSIQSEADSNKKVIES